MTKKPEYDEEEVEIVANAMYEDRECYIGHIPWEKWRAFAKFCIDYAKLKGM